MKIVEYSIQTPLENDYCIAHISDMHSNPSKKVLKSIQTISPNMICITGDFVNTSLREWPESIEFLKSCVKVARTYLSLGNHDYLISKQDIEGLGCGRFE